MVNRSETQHKDHEYKADEGCRCRGCMFYTTPIEIQVQAVGMLLPQVGIGLP